MVTLISFCWCGIAASSAITLIGTSAKGLSSLEGKYIRTPLGGFYNHSDVPTVVRMVTDSLPKLKFGDILDVDSDTKKFPGKDNDGENVFFNLQEKPDAKYFFMVAAKDIKAGDELTANYNLYTYPKTGVGLQML